MGAGRIARRTVLIGAAAIAGGVAFGTWLYRRPHENPLLAGLGEGEAALTPWVKITRDGITLITPRADMGQGAWSVQAALIAEELDVELDQVTVDPGPPAPAYYNTALADEAAPFPATDEGLVAEAARGLFDVPMKFLGMQVTGGSTTVPDQFDKLRRAGAVARETLKRAAEEVSGYPAAQMETARGVVTAPNGQGYAYTALAEVAATLEPVTRVTLRDPSEWRLIGQDMRRLDIVAKSTGTQGYGIDVRRAGMLFASLRMNPGKGAGVARFDASSAEGMRGVRRVVPVTGGVGVIADNTWRAIRAAQALDIDWEAPDYPPEQAQHWEALAASFTEARRDSRKRDDGDVEAALAEADTVIEAEYRAPYIAHQPLEPVNATVLVNEDRVDVWTGTQIPRFVQVNVARIAGVPEEAVHVHVQPIGGSFGHRLEDDVVRQATELALAMPGTPIQLTYSREEDFAQDYTRQIAMGRMRGAVREGRVEALDLSIAMPSIMASQLGRQGLSPPGPDLSIVLGAYDQPFAIPHARVTGYRAPPLAPVSSWRSVGASTNAFFHESALDELIHEAGADPMAERLRLCWHAPSRRVLEAVAEMCGWDGPRPAPGVGRGVAYCLSFGVPAAEVVQVRDTDRGLVIERVWVAAEVGRVVDPVNFDNQVQGGVVWGLGHAMNCAITYAGGAAEQSNFDSHAGMRFSQCPEIAVRALETGEIRGIGEPPVPPAAPALANAIFAATGTRLREMPFAPAVTFA